MASSPLRTRSTDRNEDEHEAISDIVSTEAVEKHDGSGEVEYKLSCSICSKAFETQELFDAHSSTHHTAEPDASQSQVELLKQLQATVAASHAILKDIRHERKQWEQEALKREKEHNEHWRGIYYFQGTLSQNKADDCEIKANFLKGKIDSLHAKAGPLQDEAQSNESQVQANARPAKGYPPQVKVALLGIAIDAYKNQADHYKALADTQRRRTVEIEEKLARLKVD